MHENNKKEGKKEEESSRRPDENLVSFVNVEKYFDKHKILDNLTLDIRRGSLTALIGRSGCGKTTLLRLLVGFYKPDSGRIIFEGRDVTRDRNSLRQSVGFCVQENSFYPELTLHKNMMFYAAMYGITKAEARKREAELFQLFSLSGHDKKSAAQVSGGMKRRLDLAIAMLHKPKLLLLDEPTTGLDPLLRDDIFSLVKKINDAGTTIIIIEHHHEQLLEHATDFVFLEKGSKLAEFSADEMRKQVEKSGSLTAEFRRLLKKEGEPR